MVITIQEVSPQVPWESLPSENKIQISLRSVILIQTTPENSLPFHLETWSLLLGYNQSKGSLGHSDNQDKRQKPRFFSYFIVSSSGCAFSKHDLQHILFFFFFFGVKTC